MTNAALHRYMMHAIDWEADRLMAGANLAELRGHGEADFERALTRLQDFIKDQRLRDANFKKGWAEQPLQPAELQEVLQAHAAAHGIGKKPGDLEKALPRQGVTPIGGITPGGYKKIAEDVYIPADQQQRQPAGQVPGQVAPPTPPASTQPGVQHSKAVQSLDGKTRITEHGAVFETGKPVTFTFARNLQAAPKVKRGMEDRFQQKVEPAGRFMNVVSPGTEAPATGVKGEITFKKPIVLMENTGDSGGIYDDKSWKMNLSRAYGGKKGKALSAAIANDGYDGIVTVGKYGTGETVDLRFLHTGVMEKSATEDPEK